MYGDGLYLFHNECCDAVFLGSHVSFGVGNDNVCIRSVGDLKLTAIQNIVVTWVCRCVHGEGGGESVCVRQ